MRRKFCLLFVGALCLGGIARPGYSQGRNGRAESRTSAADPRRFTVEVERTIRIWFSSDSHRKSLPPGLAKKEHLPPGLERQLVRNGKLPPGLEGRVEPLPPDLEIRLPGVPQGSRRVLIAGCVILLDERTSTILDVLTKVF